MKQGFFLYFCTTEFTMDAHYFSGWQNSHRSGLMLWERLQVLWPHQVTEDSTNGQRILSLKLRQFKKRSKFDCMSLVCGATRYLIPAFKMSYKLIYSSFLLFYRLRETKNRWVKYLWREKLSWSKLVNYTIKIVICISEVYRLPK